MNKITKTNPNGIKGDFGKVATVRHLTRIITYLSEIDYDYITSISKKINIHHSFVKSAMLFLVNHGLVLKKKDFRKKTHKRWGDMWYYSLNEKR